MNKLYLYDPSNGQIALTVINQPVEASAQIASAHGWECVEVEVLDGEAIDPYARDHLSLYILNGVPTERPAQATALTGLVLTDLPVPCTVYINDEAFPHDELSLELDFPLPGTYTVRVEAFPYLDWSATIPVS